MNETDPASVDWAAKRMAAHGKVARILSEALTLREAAPEILREISEALGWGLGMLWRVDADAQTMVCEEVWSSASLYSEKFIAKMRVTKHSLAAGLPGRVWITGQPIWVENYRDEDVPAKPAQSMDGEFGAACIPIKLKEKVLGAMEFLSPDKRRPDASIEEMLVIVGHLVGLFMERMATADSLRESEERYQLLADTDTDVLITFDDTLKILFANTACELVFGYQPASLAGQSLTLLIPEFARHRRIFDQSPKTKPAKFVELDGKHKNGTLVTLEGAFAEYLGKGKRYATGIMRDIGERKRTQAALRATEQKLQSVMVSTSACQIIAESPLMHTLLERVKKAAASDAPILIQGETGSGKECIAILLHEQSVRAGKSFVARNCAAIPSNLFESEMFGHKKGAFSGADRERNGAFVEADRGTLFLDEIGDLEYGLQTKLLRAIQEKIVHPVGSDRDVEANPRIICASNRDLRECITTKEFREDLFYRIATVVLKVPPLRERREDIIPLARHFVGLASKWSHKISPEAEERLVSYSWPGNVRELRSMIEQAVIFAVGNEIQADELNLPVSPDGVEQNSQSLADVERRHILQVMKENNQNKSDAAKVLKLARSTLLIKLKSYETISSTAGGPGPKIDSELLSG
jgi:two-component system response regulator HydG